MAPRAIHLIQGVAGAQLAALNGTDSAAAVHVCWRHTGHPPPRWPQRLRKGGRRQRAGPCPPWPAAPAPAPAGSRSAPPPLRTPAWRLQAAAARGAALRAALRPAHCSLHCEHLQRTAITYTGSRAGGQAGASAQLSKATCGATASASGAAARGRNHSPARWRPPAGSPSLPVPAPGAAAGSPPGRC